MPISKLTTTKTKGKVREAVSVYDVPRLLFQRVDFRVSGSIPTWKV